MGKMSGEFRLKTGRKNKRRRKWNDDKVVFVLVAIAVVVPIIGSIVFRMMEK